MIARWAIFALLCLAVPLLRAGEALDRIAAIVNGHPLLQSDWDDEIRYECFMSGRSLRDFSAEDKKSALDRLIDQELLREQMRASDFKPAGAADIEKQIDAAKSDYSREHEGRSWNEALASYGLTESVVKSHLELELNQLRLVDAHLRPTIQVEPGEIETYYKQQIVPKFGSSPAVTLKDATPQIREILVQQKINELLSSWIESLRSQAQIRILALAKDSAK